MKKSIDLLPASYRRAQLMQNRCVGWLFGLIVVAGLVVYERHVEVKAYQMDQQMLHAQQQRHAELFRKKKELPKLRQQLTEISKNQTEAPDAPSTDFTLNMLGVVSRCAKECEGRLWIDELKMSSGPQEDDPTIRLRLKGRATDNLIVATFAATLRETDAFERVELKRTQQRSDYEIRNYLLECIH